MDLIIASFRRKFNNDINEILQDLALFDPRSFDSIAQVGAPRSSLEKLSVAIKDFDADVTVAVLREKITDLVTNWKVIRMFA